MSVDPTRVLFVGRGSKAISYYRCMLPAMAMGADFAGVLGTPPKLGVATSMVRKGTAMPNLMEDYDIVVLQQPAGDGWLRTIEAMQERGVKVLFEVDDYLHGVKEVEDHDFKADYDRRFLAEIDTAMRACDGVIASTPYIKKKYKKLNKNVYLCQNGIDMKRYAFELPKRETVNIGWAGATGHLEAVKPWFAIAGAIMRARPHTTFVSIGRPFARSFQKEIGEDRALAVPWAAIEQYPAAMAMFDIALAPGGQGGWWRGKSDLRWLEASSLGVPSIVNPVIYPEVQDGATGLIATDQKGVAEALLALVDDEGLRQRIGASAREYVSEHRTIEIVKDQWLRTFERALGD